MSLYCASLLVFAIVHAIATLGYAYIEGLSVAEDAPAVQLA